MSFIFLSKTKKKLSMRSKSIPHMVWNAKEILGNRVTWLMVAYSVLVLNLLTNFNTNK